MKKSTMLLLLLTLQEAAMLHGVKVGMPFLQFLIDTLTQSDQPLMIQVNKEYKEPSAFKPLPNVRKFKIRMLSQYHPIFAKKGIPKRELTPKFDSEPYTNKSINRFISHQLLRLSQSRTQPAKFWRICKYLMQSPTFLVACFHKVFPNWHRVIPYHKVLKTMYKVVNLGSDLSQGVCHPISFRRIFIPKGEGKTRPLGIPHPNGELCSTQSMF